MKTDAPDAEVLAELINREPIFHRPEFGTSRADFDAMMMPDFWEVGASGTTHSREFVLDELEKRHGISQKAGEGVWETSEFRVQTLAEDVYLLTYVLLQDKIRTTRRATIWRRTTEGWKIVFHQGTILSSTPPVE
jgi:hypothetical protein